ncbi:hypothetical protein MOW08_15410 (plasmid) [Acinetobacter schindleri]|nr:hypothetical protein MOW08_15455 [Acinetobacter schindleri]UOH76522.1 hypothetical protein MOW08_15500 [Acinetobacter schindleri]UOH76530.1 hypothetical protein MOW08_15410 [Acinetobacter schindleri]
METYLVVYGIAIIPILAIIKSICSKNVESYWYYRFVMFMYLTLWLFGGVALFKGDPALLWFVIPPIAQIILTSLRSLLRD